MLGGFVMLAYVFINTLKGGGKDMITGQWAQVECFTVSVRVRSVDRSLQFIHLPPSLFRCLSGSLHLTSVCDPV